MLERALLHAVVQRYRPDPRRYRAALDAVHGSEPGDRYLLPGPVGSFAEQARAGSRPLRVAVSTTPSSGPGTVDPECVAAVRRVADALTGMGHTVVEAAPAVDAEAVPRG